MHKSTFTQNEIINTIASLKTAGCIVSHDRRFLIGVTFKGVIIVTDHTQPNIVTLGRFRKRVELYRFLKNS